MKKLSSHLRVTELDTTADAIVRIFKADQTASKDEFLKTTIAEIEDLSAKITTAIKAAKAVSPLEAANARRNEIIRSLGALLNGYAAFPADEKKAAASSLLAVFGKYKGITGESYANESSLIESMLEDFSAEGLADAIKSLDGVSDYITSLRAEQNEFNRANDELTAANSNKSDSASAIKKPLLTVINEKLVPYVTAMSMANASVYADFDTKAGAEIEKANASASKRRKSATKEEDSDGGAQI